MTLSELSFSQGICPVPLLLYSGSVLDWSICNSLKYHAQSHLSDFDDIVFFCARSLHLLFIHLTNVDWKCTTCQNMCAIHDWYVNERGIALPSWSCQCHFSQPLLLPLNPPSLTTEPLTISFFLSSSKLIVCHMGSVNIYWLINLSVVIENANILWR